MRRPVNREGFEQFRSILIKAVTISLIILISSSNRVDAIKDGEEALGDVNVTTIFSSDFSPLSHCSAVYLEKRIVITAAHCLIRNKRADGQSSLVEYFFDPKQSFVSQPGINWAVDESPKVRVLDFYIPEFESYNSEWIHSYPGREGDIAFLFLESELKGKPLNGIASKEMIASAKSAGVVLQVLGYGNTNYQIRNSGTPYSALVRARERVSDRSGIDSSLYLSAVGVGRGSICPGDSGGPIIWNKPEGRLLVGITFGGGTQTCHFGKPHFGDWSVEATLVWPYESILKKKYEEFLRYEAEAKAKAEAEAKAKAEAEAKAKAEATKKITITCVKGKLTKRITAVKPKCPTGYKKK